MRQQALNQAAIKLSESYDSNCEALLDDDDLVQIFGKKYANCPEEFEFLPGEREFIKKIVAHVKKLVDDGTGEKLFKQKKKKQTKSSRQASPKRSEHTNNRETMLKELYDCATNCLKLHNVDMAAWNEQCVEIQANGTSGSIRCIVCGESKRVSYCTSEERSSFWALSNFKKHLKNKHNLKSKPNEAKPKSTDRKSNRKSKSVKKLKIEPSVINITTTTDDSVLQNIDGIDSTQRFDGNSSSIQIIMSDDENRTTEPWLCNQISEQITQMVGAVLINGEKQEQMEYQLKNESPKYLSVIPTARDGNCLFSALAHQLWKNKINRNQTKNEHEKMIKDLRSTVVEHILQPDNFPLYERFLHDRVSELKNIKDAETISDKCKLFVRQNLSREGSWGGMETIRAVSVLHRVNVLVINEFGTSYLIKGTAEKYDRTILIAYRMSYDDAGECCYNHYDSISDMGSDDMFSVADAALYKFKSK